jgi:WD40 repeat protein
MAMGRAILVWDLSRKGAAPTSLKALSDPALSLTFAGDYLVSADEEQHIRGVPLSGKGQSFELSLGLPVRSMVGSPNGRFIAVSLAGGRLIVLEQLADSVRTISVSAWADPQSMIFSPDSQRLATCSDLREVSLIDPSTGAARALKLNGPCAAVAFDHRSRLLAAADREGVTLFSLPDGNSEKRLPQLTRVQALAFSSTGEELASLSTGLEIVIWNLAHDKEVTRFHSGIGDEGFAFSADDRFVIQGNGSAIHRRSSDLIQDACRRLTRTLTSEEIARYLEGQKPLSPCEVPAAVTQ